MSLIHDTIYPTLSSRYSDKALTLNFTPTAAELAFVATQAKQRVPQSALLVMLKVASHLHYIPSPTDIPVAVVKYISAFLGPRGSLKKHQLKAYQQSGTFKRHCRLLRDYLNFEADEDKRNTYCASVGVELAEVKENLADIINALIEALIKQHFELPAFTSLERMARRFRSLANTQLYERLRKDLSAEQLQHLEALFDKPTDGQTESDWQRVKQEPNKPTASNIRDFLRHYQWLGAVAQPLPSVGWLPVSKREQLYHEAIALHSSDIRQIKPAKRIALAVVLVQAQWAQAIDDLTEMFIKVVNDLESEGRQLFKAELFEQRSHTDELIGQLRDLLHAYQSSSAIKQPTKRLQLIESVFSDDPEELLASCEAHLALSKNNDRPYVIQAFRKKRKLLFQILEHLPLAADAERQPLIAFAKTLLSLYRHDTAEVLSLSVSPKLIEALPNNWLPLIYMEKPTQTTPMLHRYSLEAAWFLSVKEQLKTFNCYVTGGQRFGDPSEQLVTDEEYSELVDEYEELSGVATDGKALVKQLKAELTALANDIDQRFPDLKGVHLKDDQLVLQRAFTNYRSDTLEPLRTAINQAMPKVSIIDVITDTVRWLKLDKLFKPHSGLDGKIDDPQLRLIVTLFCYGCNVGAQETMDSVKNLSRKQVAWLSARYANDTSLEKAIKRVTDTYAKMDLPKQWGSGTHASADGTHRPTYDANLLSEFHFRYRLRGGIGYYIVSDQYIALFSHFIACGAHESWYILDGVAQNDMDIQPTILHGDTHAQNYVVFGLAHLLGIQLMPRIRGIKHLKFYKPSAKTKYTNIEPLFSDSIKWSYIEKGLPEMLRIVLSIRSGKITPSAILRRLNTYSEKNHLYKAFQELGKVARTLFLLKCISDPELRKIIHRETNKSEQFNDFSSWLFFGNGGVIRYNERRNQAKIVKYHHLVSSLVVLFNAHHMTKALEKLKQDGYHIVKADLGHTSPYRKFGINLFGSYDPNLKKRLEPIANSFSFDDELDN